MRQVFIALIFASVGLARAATITNVTPVNVTPTSFSILWRAGNSTPSIEVFADPAGATNRTSQLGVEAYPAHTGNPDLAAGYARRQSQIALGQKCASLGLMLLQVTGCRPGTTYYYRLTSTPAVGSPIVYPASGPLPAITTEVENTFVADDQQLIIDVPGLDTFGQVVTLSHTNASYPLAALVGDGVGTNQVFFNLNDLFTLAAGGGNFAPIGAQTFNANVLGSNQSDTPVQFVVTFTGNFLVAGATQVSVGTEFVAVSLGSTVLQTSQTSSIPVSFNSSVGLASVALQVNLNPGHLTNFMLQSLSAEIDPALVTATLQNQTNLLLQLPARSGQTILGAHTLAQLRFSAIPGQPSAFVPLKLRQITALKPGASPVGNLFGASGRAVVVGQESLLEAGMDSHGQPSLMLYAKPNTTCAIEYTTNLSQHAWTRLPPVPVTELTTLLAALPGVPPPIFYRAVEFAADPPILRAVRNPDQSRQLLIFGQPTRQYAVEYKTNLSSVGWYPLFNTTLTNSFGYVPVGQTNGAIFYRLRRNP